MKTPKTASTRLVLPRGVSGTEPADADAGTLSFDPVSEDLRIKLAAGWSTLSGGGGGPPTGAAGGDLGGTYPNPTVVQARGLVTATTTVVVDSATAPTSGQVLTATSGTAATWQTISTTPSGAAGGDLGGTYPNPTVTQARGLRETAGPTTLVIAAVADLNLLTRVGTDVVGRKVSDFTAKTTPANADETLIGDSAASNALKRSTLSSLAYVPNLRRGALWMPPIIPNNNDVEFDSGSAPSGWAWWKSGSPFTSQTVGSTIDLYRAGYTSGDPEVSYTWRGSHLAFTVPSDGNFYYFLKDFTSLPTDAFFWTRLSSNRRSTTTALSAGDCRIELVLLGQVGGVPDNLTNSVFLQYVYDTNTTPAFRYRWGGLSAGVNVGGTATANFATTFDSPVTEIYPYFGIQKIGTTYHGMLCNEAGHVVYLGAITVSGTLRYVGIRASEVTTTPTAWTSVRTCDFIRQIDTGDGYFGLGQ